jgi:phosphinothricin acetyltransferase
MKIIHCNYDEHAQAILDIFNHEIINTTALYDYNPRTMANMETWFSNKTAGKFPVIGILNETNQLAGFASYGTFRAWPAYKYSVEHSVYIHKDFRGKGLASTLIQELVKHAKQQQLHTLIGAIDKDNNASVELHKKLGFQHAGTIKQAGFKFGRWLDVVFYQLIIETPENPVDG